MDKIAPSSGAPSVGPETLDRSHKDDVSHPEKPVSADDSTEGAEGERSTVGAEGGRLDERSEDVCSEGDGRKGGTVTMREGVEIGQDPLSALSG